MRHLAFCIVLPALCATALPQGSAEPPVKKSRQGICYERGSGTYQRTTHFDAFDTMEQCLASGGRVAKNAPLDKHEESESGSSSWLGKVGGKIALIVGMLVVVGGAFLLSRRRAP